MKALTGRARVFLKCASCRFAVFYFLPFYAALEMTEQATPAYAVFGVFFWLLMSLAIEVTNRLSDRTEDAINRAERTSLCAEFGWERLAWAQRALWTGVALLAGGWIVVRGNGLLVAMLVMAGLLGIGYSRGPRFARRGLFPFVTLSMLFGGAFLLGWAAGDPLSEGGLDDLAQAMPMLVAVGLLIASLAGMKDVTDVDGDAHIQYHSRFVRAVKAGRSSRTILVSLPFALIGLLIATGLLPTSFVVLFLFAPAAAALAHAVVIARDDAQLLLVREAFYVYWLAVSSTAVLLLTPTWTMLATVAGSVLFWMVATRFLHWSKRSPVAGIRLARELSSTWRLRSNEAEHAA
jgi:4-hydroxybenzoate polyprenyltransferase